MGMTAIPNPACPATPVTSVPGDEYQIYGGSDALSKIHPSDARATDSAGGNGGSPSIDVVGTDGALRL